MNIRQFLEQLTDMELCDLQDMITREFQRRSEDYVHGVGRAIANEVPRVPLGNAEVGEVTVQR